jgi:hypothetical protein
VSAVGQLALGQTADASFSPDGAYRWWLTREWGTGPRVAFVGLNPSTANADRDDPTIRRCIRFARDWGYSGLTMANLFGVVSADPALLVNHPDPVGERNDETLAALTHSHGLIVAAWGAFPEARIRAREVVEAILTDADWHVLGLTKDGYPRHPLYMRADCKPQTWVYGHRRGER